MIGIIYKITNLVNNKIYIGQTRQELKTRYSQHLNSKDNFPIHCAIRKYSKENFKCEVLEKIEFENLKELSDSLNELEIKYIKDLNSQCPNGYNIKSGGQSYNDGYKASEKELIHFGLESYIKEPIIYKNVVYNNIISLSMHLKRSVIDLYNEIVFSYKNSEFTFVNDYKIIFHGEASFKNSTLRQIRLGQSEHIIFYTSKITYEEYINYKETDERVIKLQKLRDENNRMIKILTDKLIPIYEKLGLDNINKN